jgi:hypothetical protein
VAVCLAPIAASFPLYKSWQAVASYPGRPPYDHAVMSSFSGPLPWGGWAAALGALVLAFKIPKYLSERPTRRNMPKGAGPNWSHARRVQAHVVALAWSLAFATPAVLIALTLMRPAMSLSLNGIWRSWQGPHEYAPILLGAAAVIALCRPRNLTE